jgi:hypothetical protein
MKLVQSEIQTARAIKTKSGISRSKNFSTHITLYTKIISRNSAAFKTVKVHYMYIRSV